MDYVKEILYLSEKILRYESVYGHGGFGADAVFGRTIVDCQKEMLQYCSSIGLTTYLDPEGMYGYAQTGPGDEYIALLTHLDIVGAGDESQWENPPFEPFIDDEKIVARGTSDDKVPAAMSVILLKKLLDEGVPLKYPIRIIFGSDEETGFRCIEKYKKVHNEPKYTLVFDGTFPFSYSEKHLLNYELYTKSKLNIIGGVGYNSVMDFVQWFKEDTIEEAHGVSAHASAPTKGENALVKLSYLHPGEDEVFDLVNGLLEPSGEHKLNLIEDSAHNKEMTLNIGMIKNNVVFADIRIPPDIDWLSFAERFEAFIRSMNALPVRMDTLIGVKTDLESEFAKTVLNCYREVTGDQDSQPFKTGSATYGRSFSKNCLSFGPRMGYHITNTHKPNEFVPFDLIHNAFEIYLHTLRTIEEVL